MYYFNSNFYAVIVILFVTFFEYQAFESNIERHDITSLNFKLNDITKRHSMNNYQIEIKGQQKREVKKSKKTSKSKKTVKKTSSSKPKPKTKTKTTTTVKPKIKKPTTKVSTTKKSLTTTSTTKISITKKPSATKSTTKITSTSKNSKKKPKSIKTTTTIYPPVTPDKFNKDREKLYEDINRLRQKHQVSNLTVDPLLAHYAQNFVIACALGEFPFGLYEDKYGETYASSTIENGISPFCSWTIDSNSINYDRVEETSSNREFTQLIWKDTKKIGCGIMRNLRLYYIYCLFDPKGNIPGKFNENVKRPLN